MVKSFFFHRLFSFALAFFGLLLVDQGTKHFLPDWMPFPWFGIHFTTNTGAGFSLLEGNTVFLALFGGVFFFFLLFLLFKKHLFFTPFLWPFVLLLAGIAGNTLDRIFFRGVIDFIKIGWWPVFNLADVFLVIGGIWLGFLLFQHQQ